MTLSLGSAYRMFRIWLNLEISSGDHVILEEHAKANKQQRQQMAKKIVDNLNPY